MTIISSLHNYQILKIYIKKLPENQEHSTAKDGFIHNKGNYNLTCHWCIQWTQSMTLVNRL